MTLFRLMQDHEAAILEKCRQKMAVVIGSRWEAEQLDTGLATLYHELIEVLAVRMKGEPQESRRELVDDVVSDTTQRENAREIFHSGYTVSQLVHGYGSLCQAITEYATDLGAPITADEFCQLNLALDVAIAHAVEEFEQLSLSQAAAREDLRFGFLAHELRNALSNATMANDLIRSGVVTSAEAGSIVTRSLQRMLRIINRAMTEARMEDHNLIEFQQFKALYLISEVEATALADAAERKIAISSAVQVGLMLHGDRHLVASALSHVVHNAVKFTPAGGRVWIRAFAVDGRAHIEVEDQGGGLAGGWEDRIFQPDAIVPAERGGVGGGLPTAYRAIELNNGELSVRNMPGTGCVFTITLPLPEDNYAIPKSEPAGVNQAQVS